MPRTLENQILAVLQYFAYFKYAPSFEEIYTFLPVKITKKALELGLSRLLTNEKVLGYKRHSGERSDSRISSIIVEKTLDFARVTQRAPSEGYYALPGHSTYFKERVVRAAETKKKLERVSLYIRLAARLPCIKFIGLSGSCAMGHASKKDDVDLFIIATQGRLWSTRFFALFLAELLGIRRRRKQTKAPGKVCLNLLFDERDVFVNPTKQNLYTAHEVVQMKPLLNKDQAYEKFLVANKWVRKFFPNVFLLSSRGVSENERRGDLKRSSFWGAKRLQNLINLHALAMTPGNFAELVLKTIQLYFINHHRTTEIITDTQLWFFPRDFEKKLRKEKVI